MFYQDHLEDLSQDQTLDLKKSLQQQPRKEYGRAFQRFPEYLHSC